MRITSLFPSILGSMSACIQLLHHRQPSQACHLPLTRPCTILYRYRSRASWLILRPQKVSVRFRVQLPRPASVACSLVASHCFLTKPVPPPLSSLWFACVCDGFLQEGQTSWCQVMMCVAGMGHFKKLDAERGGWDLAGPRAHRLRDGWVWNGYL